LSLPKWNKIFFAAAASDNVLASSAAMVLSHEGTQLQDSSQMQVNHQRRIFWGPSLLTVSFYSPSFKEDEVAHITEINHVSGVLAYLKGGITANNSHHQLHRKP
jgi:hypothetical protein